MDIPNHAVMDAAMARELLWLVNGSERELDAMSPQEQL